jgi:stage IV sporulation protein FB
MGFEDRPYYRDRGASGSFGGGPLEWILTGSVPLMTVAGIRVRAHASLVIYAGLIILFGFGRAGFTIQDRITYTTLLFGIVLLHEFGHCFTARWVGGEADDILMHPLGGLAFARPPHRPLPTFLTVAGGPAVNVVICILSGAVLWLGTGWLPSNPFTPQSPLARGIDPNWMNFYWYVFWIYAVSYQLLMFNLLPIFPLDGGQMLQAILWPRLGYYRSMIISTTIGMVGAVLGGVWALAFGNIGLAVLAIFGFITCYNLRNQLRAAGPYAFSEDTTDFSAAYEKQQSKQRKESARAQRKAEKERAAEVAEQAKIDAILAKVSSQGMQSLTNGEKRTLSQATERQRQAEVARLKRAR